MFNLLARKTLIIVLAIVLLISNGECSSLPSARPAEALIILKEFHMPSEVLQGADAKIEISFENQGEQQGSIDVRLYVDDQLVKEEHPLVSPGGHVEVSHFYKTDIYTSIGIHEVRVGNVVKNFTVVAPPPTGALPTVVTDLASDITDIGATLHGSVAGLGKYNKINVYFEYGTSTGYEISTNMVQQEFTAPGSFTTTITGLEPDIRYLFHAKGYVWDDSGQFVSAIMVFGETKAFTTAHEDIFQYHQ